jgi:hypothetical protein
MCCFSVLVLHFRTNFGLLDGDAKAIPEHWCNSDESSSRSDLPFKPFTISVWTCLGFISRGVGDLGSSTPLITAQILTRASFISPPTSGSACHACQLTFPRLERTHHVAYYLHAHSRTLRDRSLHSSIDLRQLPEPTDVLSGVEPILELTL